MKAKPYNPIGGYLCYNPCGGATRDGSSALVDSNPTSSKHSQHSFQGMTPGFPPNTEQALQRGSATNEDINLQQTSFEAKFQAQIGGNRNYNYQQKNHVASSSPNQRIYETKDSQIGGQCEENVENIEQTYADEEEPVGTDIHDSMTNALNNEFPDQCSTD